MTDDEIVALQDPHVALGMGVVEQLEQHCFQHIMTTEPHEQKEA
jgi:hypothetical protein